MPRTNGITLAAGIFACAILGAFGSAARADWLTMGFDVAHTGFNPAETALGVATAPALRQQWARNLGAPILTQPTVARGVSTAYGPLDLVYAGTQTGLLAALNAATGAPIWQVKLPALQTQCDDFAATGGLVGLIATPTLDRAGNRAFVAGADGRLHALDLGTGREQPGWPVTLTDPLNAGPRTFVYGSPTLNPGLGLLYLTTASACDFAPYHGEIIAVSLAAPAVVARFVVTGASGPDGGGIWGPGGVSLDAGNVYAATGNAIGPNEGVPYGNAIVKLPPDLSGVVASHTPSLTGFDVDFGATPTLMQRDSCPPQLAALNKSGALFLYDRTTAALAAGPRQRLQLAPVPADNAGSLIGSPAYDPGRARLFVPNPADDGSGRFSHGLLAFDLRPDCTLALAWQAPAGLNAAEENPVVPPTVANGVVYYASGGGSTLNAFAADSGALLWSSGKSIGGGLLTAPTVEGGQLFLAGYGDGTLRAFAPPITRRTVLPAAPPKPSAP